MRDLFQQKPRRGQRWDPIRDRERSRKIRVLKLPTISDGGKDLALGGKEDTQDATEDQNPKESATNTFHNASPRAKRAPHEAQQHRNEDESPRSIEELTGTQEREDRATRKININDTGEQSRDRCQAHGDEVTSAEAVQWSKDAERLRCWLEASEPDGRNGGLCSMSEVD